MLRRYFCSFTSRCSKHAIAIDNQLKVRSWQIHDYGDIKNIQLGSVRIPVIRKPKEVLVHVWAASVNPIDLYMIGGYGRTLFQIPRQGELELPLTVGRDFSGTIIGKGTEVGNNFQIGDEVYGFIPIHRQGSFVDVVLADTSYILPKPRHLSHIESSSLVYATMTAWSALYGAGNLLFKETKGLRVLILGASGGVGTAAIQLLKSQGCIVFGTCSENAVKMVSDLGTDKVFNYNDKNFIEDVQKEGRYHIVLDMAKVGYGNIPKSWKYDKFITLNSPLLVNTDTNGLFCGLIQSAGDLIQANLSQIQNRSTVRWGFFLPSQRGFRFIHDLIVNKKINPVIHKVFNFDQIPEALQALANGHSRGKIVINFT